MCGIAGFYGLPKLSLPDLKKMTDAIRHRGPDGEGHRLFENTGTGLGHRRLAILDLSPLGAQPMTYEDSGLWITYNGEIYNFLSLRQELQGKGYRFKSETDTEVILAAYLEWGTKAFLKFNGMWAFALYDERQQSLLLSRDRFGIKPLYYKRSTQGGGLLFGSECKVFKDIPGHPMEWDKKGVLTAIYDPGLLESSGSTIFKDIKNLPPGSLLRAKDDEISIEQWWDTAKHLSSPPSKYSDQVEEFRSLFEDACSLRLVSDVPVATSLSGGLDSSSVACVLAHLLKTGKTQARAQTEVQKTFFHGFEGSQLDESEFAKTVGRHLGSEFVEIKAPNKIDVDNILLSLEGIFYGLPDASWRVYHAQRATNTVVSLDGHGADEMLGGYDWYLSGSLVSSFSAPSEWKKLFEQYKAQTGDFFSYPRFLKSLAKGLISSRVGPDEAAIIFLKKTFTNSFSYVTEPLSSSSIYHAPSVDIPSDFEIPNRLLYLDFHQRILPRLLKNFDTMSMAHGVEVRMPFMDYRLVDFSFSLPAYSKIGEGYSKRILRDAMKDWVPSEIRTRKGKLGFNSPLPDWMIGKLKHWVLETLNNPSDFDDLIDRNKASQNFAEWLQQGHIPWDEAMKFWATLSAIRLGQIWFQ